VINGEKETGVTTFKLQHEIDTGNILMQERFPIGDDETPRSARQDDGPSAQAYWSTTIKGLADGTLKEIPQKSIVNSELSTTQAGSPFTIHHSLKHAPKYLTETGKIDWAKPVDEIYNLIRGLSPYPAAFTELQAKH